MAIRSLDDAVVPVRSFTDLAGYIAPLPPPQPDPARDATMRGGR
ncbi:hypothetical protein [Tabrizicola sp. M-4]